MGLYDDKRCRFFILFSHRQARAPGSLFLFLFSAERCECGDLRVAIRGASCAFAVVQRALHTAEQPDLLEAVPSSTPRGRSALSLNSSLPFCVFPFSVP